MKIVCLSDTHCQLANIKVPDSDILVHAGDLTYRGDLSEIETEMAILGKLPHKTKILIAGNHDWLFQREPAAARAIAESNGVTYLQDIGIEIEGVRFWGSPWQPEFGNWAFNLSRYEGGLSEKWAQIPDDTDVLITHGPPLGIGDMTKSYNGMPKENVGCFDLMARVKQIKPKVHVFGHIHPSYGVYCNYPESPATAFVNASCCNEQYDPINEPVVMEI